jgi:hypothetical protein
VIACEVTHRLCHATGEPKNEPALASPGWPARRA